MLSSCSSKNPLSLHKINSNAFPKPGFLAQSNPKTIRHLRGKEWRWESSKSVLHNQNIVSARVGNFISTGKTQQHLPPHSLQQELWGSRLCSEASVLLWQCASGKACVLCVQLRGWSDSVQWNVGSYGCKHLRCQTYWFPIHFWLLHIWRPLTVAIPPHTQLCNPVCSHDPQFKKADAASSLAAIQLPNNHLLSFSIRNLAGQSCFNKSICWNLLCRFLEEKWLEFYYTLKLGNRIRTSWESTK